MTSFLADSFSAAADTDLALHTPELGGAWQRHPAYVPAATILAAEGRLTGASSSATAFYVNLAAPPAGDYAVRAVGRVTSTSSSNRIGLLVRFDATQDTGYCVWTGRSSWTLSRVRDAAWETLASIGQTLATHTDYALCLAVFGDTLEFLVDGVSLIHVVDPEPITAVGHAGLMVRAASRIDDVAAQPLTAQPVRLGHGALEIVSAPDPSAQLTHGAVELLILAHVDAQLAHAAVEVMTRARPHSGAIEFEADAAAITVSAHGALDNDLYATAALSAQVAGEAIALGTPLPAAVTALRVATQATLDRGTVLGGEAAIGLSFAPAEIETGVVLQGEAAIALGSAGALTAPHALGGSMALECTAGGELLLGHELRATAALRVAGRGTLIVKPETPTGFFLLF